MPRKNAHELAIASETAAKLENTKKLLEKSNERIEKTKKIVANTPQRILCISYEESLLLTRKMILEHAGYDVTPALGFAEAMERCSNDPAFDLIVMGHSLPRKDKTALISALRPTCKSPVLSVRKHGDSP